MNEELREVVLIAIADTAYFPILNSQALEYADAAIAAATPLIERALIERMVQEGGNKGWMPGPYCSNWLRSHLPKED